MSVVGHDTIISKAKEIQYLPHDFISYADYCKRLIAEGNDWLLGYNVAKVKQELGLA